MTQRLTNFYRYQNRLNNEDARKYFGTLSHEVNPVVVTGVANGDLPFGSIVVANMSQYDGITNPTINRESELGQVTRWALPTVAPGVNDVLGVVVRKNEEYFGRPVWQTDYTTQVDEASFVYSGEGVAIMTAGHIYVRTRATLVNPEATIYLVHEGADAGQIAVAASASTTSIINVARSLENKNKVSTGVEDIHAVKCWFDFRQRPLG